QVGGDVVGVGDADVGGGAGGDVGDDVVVDIAVVGVQAQRHRDVGVQRLKVRNGLLVNFGLADVGIVFGPEGDLIVPGRVKGGGHREGRLFAAAVAAGQQQRPGQSRRGERGWQAVFHPLVPPLDTPSMILLRNARNSKISG